MRYWYDSDNLSWTSNDGYEIWLDSDIYGYKLFSPNGFLLGVWYCDDLRKQIGDLDIKLYEYMFYKAERFLTVKCIIKFKDNTCGACHHLIFKDFRHREGLCNLFRLHRCFEDHCIHEEEMS